MTIAIVFPGQGSQSVGMLADLADDPITQATFAEASEACSIDLLRLAMHGPAEELDQTVNTQPALLAASVATYRIWLDRGGARPLFMGGHSLGEYSALVAAEAIDLGPAAQLVAERGRLMQAAVPPGTGAMAAVLGLDDDALKAVCAEAAQGDVVAPANYNSPGQVVIAGSAAAVDRAIEAATSAGARRVVKLAVSVPSHCELMRPAAEALEARLADVEIRAPKIPIVHNVDVRTHADPQAIRKALVAQLYRPVRWTEVVRALVADGIDIIVECGPGKVLTGLMRRIDRSIKAQALVDSGAIENAISAAEGED